MTSKTSKQFRSSKANIILTDILIAGGIIGVSLIAPNIFQIFRLFNRDQDIDQKRLKIYINSLKRRGLLINDIIQGELVIRLSEKGYQLAQYQAAIAQPIPINKKWNRCWYMVIFDIPERLRKGRDALRGKLLEIGFYEFQKSALIVPYECKNEVNFVIEFFDLRKYVRFCVLESIDNELHLKKIFNLV